MRHLIWIFLLLPVSSSAQIFPWPLRAILGGTYESGETVTYDDLRFTACNATDLITVTSPTETVGQFECQDTDPHGDGDDGGTVIASFNSKWWVRQFTYNAENPIELDWFELANDEDVTTLMDNLLTGWGGNTDLFVKFPTAQRTLRMDYLERTSVDSLYILENTTDDTLKWVDTPTNDYIMWHFNDLSVLVLGTEEDRDPDSYKLTFHGNTTGLGEASIGRRGLFQTHNNGGALKYTIRANFYWTRRSGFVDDGDNIVGGGFRGALSGGGVDTTIVSGRFYQSGVQMFGAWDYFFADTMKVYDPMGRSVGWDGTTNADNADYNVYGGGKNYTLSLSGGGSGSKLAGRFEGTYGIAKLFLAGIDSLGESLADPFVIYQDSMMHTASGVRIKPNTGINNQLWKSDSWDYTGYATRYVKSILDGPTGTLSAPWFFRQQACENGAGNSQYTNYILETGDNYSEVGFTVPNYVLMTALSAACGASDFQRGAHIYGAAEDEPGLTFEVRIADNDTLSGPATYGTIRVEYGRAPFNTTYPAPDDNLIRWLRVEDVLEIESGITGTVLDSLRVKSTTQIQAGSSFTCTGTGTVSAATYNGNDAALDPLDIGGGFYIICDG